MAATNELGTDRPAATSERILEVAFDADDDTASWLFDQVADLVHNTEEIIDPVVSTRPDTDAAAPAPRRGGTDPLANAVGKTLASTWSDDTSTTLVFDDGEAIRIPRDNATGPVDGPDGALHPLFGSGDCDGSGYIIENPAWPEGDLPYRSHCSGCARCEDDDAG